MNMKMSHDINDSYILRKIKESKFPESKLKNKIVIKLIIVFILSMQSIILSICGLLDPPKTGQEGSAYVLVLALAIFVTFINSVIISFVKTNIMNLRKLSPKYNYFKYVFYAFIVLTLTVFILGFSCLVIYAH